MNEISRRMFLGAGSAMLATAGCSTFSDPDQRKGKKVIQGFEETEACASEAKPFVPYSDRRVRVGIAGEGVCSFGSAFAYQSCPNVEVVACAEVQPERLKLLQGRVGAKKAYPSCEEMIRHAAEDKLEAIYIATDAPSHVQLAIMALEHGLHVACAVPAFFGKDQLEFVPKLLDAEKRSGKIYMMNETTAFRPQCYAMRRLFEDGRLGKITYTEGEYFHPSGNDLNADGTPSFKGWRKGMPPQYYPTHSNGYYTCVTHRRFTEVTCTGLASLKYAYAKGNRYDNPYGSEYAMFACEDGSSARMLVAWDTPAFGGEDGRIWGQKGCFVPEKSAVVNCVNGYRGWYEDDVRAHWVDYLKPQLAPGMVAGGHGGSHGYLTDDFIRGILLPGHKVCVDSVTALNTTIAGVYAHLSAMKGGERLKIPAVC